MKPVAVTIPLYKKEPSENELLSLRQCGKVLGHYPVIFFAPESLELSLYLKIIPQAQVIRFADSYFSGIPGYNRLLLSPFFYESFAEYDYILIYQPDAWCFQDTLMEWVNKGYDYIGAPLRPSSWNESFEKEWIVGNGGLSLRKVSAILRELRKNSAPMYGKSRLKLFLKHHWHSGHVLRTFLPLLRLCGIGNRRGPCLRYIIRKGGYNEDIIFHEFSSQYQEDGLNIAPVEDAARFAWDRGGEELQKQYNISLPFGCHAWEKANNSILNSHIRTQMRELS